MKIRNGFVSNSSSCSFLVSCNPEKTKMRVYEPSEGERAYTKINLDSVYKQRPGASFKIIKTKEEFVSFKILKNIKKTFKLNKLSSDDIIKRLNNNEILVVYNKSDGDIYITHVAYRDKTIFETNQEHWLLHRPNDISHPITDIHYACDESDGEGECCDLEQLQIIKERGIDLSLKFWSGMPAEYYAEDKDVTVLYHYV